MATVFERNKRREHGFAVRDVFPNRFAITRQYPNQGVHQGAAEDAEADAVRCAHCGAPIESAANLSVCWHCGSDNFLGRRFSRP